MSERSAMTRAGVVLGGLLIAVGLTLLVAQLVGIGVLAPWWPLVVIVPGLGLTAIAFAARDVRGLGYLAVPGSTLMVTGGVLLAQSLTRQWQSWSYVWPLIAPGSVGLGLLLAGIREKARPVRGAGWLLLGIGVALFVLSEWFFVGVLGVGGIGLGGPFDLALPLLLVTAGILVIWFGVRGTRDGRG